MLLVAVWPSPTLARGCVQMGKEIWELLGRPGTQDTVAISLEVPAQGARTLPSAGRKHDLFVNTIRSCTRALELLLNRPCGATGWSRGNKCFVQNYSAALYTVPHQ